MEPLSSFQRESDSNIHQSNLHGEGSSSRHYPRLWHPFDIACFRRTSVNKSVEVTFSLDKKRLWAHLEFVSIQLFLRADKSARPSNDGFISRRNSIYHRIEAAQQTSTHKDWLLNLNFASRKYLLVIIVGGFQKFFGHATIVRIRILSSRHA